jgi:hypothetical protein
VQDLRVSPEEGQQAKDLCVAHSIRWPRQLGPPIRLAGGSTHAGQLSLPKRTKTLTIAEQPDPGILRRKRQATGWRTSTGHSRGRVEAELQLLGRFAARLKVDRVLLFFPAGRLGAVELHQPNCL